MECTLRTKQSVEDTKKFRYHIFINCILIAFFLTLVGNGIYALLGLKRVGLKYPR